jgi:hypothetical protein
MGVSSYKQTHCRTSQEAPVSSEICKSLLTVLTHVILIFMLLSIRRIMDWKFPENQYKKLFLIYPLF